MSKKRKKKKSKNEKVKINECGSKYLPWAIIWGMDKKEILNPPLNMFLIPAFKIDLYMRDLLNALYHISINHEFTWQTGLNGVELLLQRPIK